VLFDADAAAICLVVDGANAATLGASGPPHGYSTSCSSPWAKVPPWTQ
jgi:hypothetical protein